MKKFLGLLSVFALVGSVFAADIQLTDEQAGRGYKVNILDDDGWVIGTASVTAESWKSNEMTKYVARYNVGARKYEFRSFDRSFWEYNYRTRTWKKVTRTHLNVISKSVGGRFVTGLTGQLEKWDINGSKNESVVIVFRSNGKFLTWKDVSDDLHAGWNRRKGTGWVYEVRYKAGTPMAGELVNSASLTELLKNKKKAFVDYTDRNICKRLVVRDTDDAANNGKILTVVAGTYKRRTDGEGWCYYYAPPSPFESGVSHKQLTSMRVRKAK